MRRHDRSVIGATLEYGILMPTFKLRRPLAQRAAWPTLLTASILVLASLTGGSSRADISSLIVLRPIALLLAALGLSALTMTRVREFKGYFIVFACAVGLVILHLVPLPPVIWQSLPGRGLVTEIDRAAGLVNLWRPLTLDPTLATNALWSLAVPLAVLFAASGLDERGTSHILAIVLLMGMASAVLGVLQFAAGPNSPLYFYRVTNNGSAVGLLANRNHHGVFLATMFPLITAYAAAEFGRQRRRDHRGQARGDIRLWAAAVVAAMFLPVIFASSSRAGIAAAAIGVSGAILVAWPRYRSAQAQASRPNTGKPGIVDHPWFRLLLIAGAGIGFVAFAVVFFGMTQGNAVDRLLANGEANPELRWAFWQVTWQAIGNFMPIGSGVGSFVAVFQIYEPGALLSPLYVNHAHNDYLELLLETGLFGPALLLAGLALVWRDSWMVWRHGDGAQRAVLFGRGASVALGQFAFASIFDYPLRTGMLAAIAMFLVILLRRGARAASGQPS